MISGKRQSSQECRKSTQSSHDEVLLSGGADDKDNAIVLSLQEIYNLKYVIVKGDNVH